MQNQKKRLIPILIALAAIILTVGITFFIILGQKNPYGNSIKITNFNSQFKNVPKNTQQLVSASLYNAVEMNLSDIPKNTSAIIRDSTANESYDQASDIYYGTFVVDIPELKQSYDVQFVWGDNPEAIANNSYQALVSCPQQNQIIYKDFECRDMFSDDPIYNLINKNPFINKLPIIKTYYTQTGAYVSYSVALQYTNDYNSFKLIITDNTGGNYENALNDLRGIGADPSKLTIEYKDESKSTTNMVPGRPRN